MKLAKAIEILQDYLRGDEPDNAPDLPDAIRRGIESMKREQILRHEIPYDEEGLLPGETEA